MAPLLNNLNCFLKDIYWHATIQAKMTKQTLSKENFISLTSRSFGQIHFQYKKAPRQQQKGKYIHMLYNMATFHQL